MQSKLLSFNLNCYLLFRETCLCSLEDGFCTRANHVTLHLKCQNYIGSLSLKCGLSVQVMCSLVWRMAAEVEDSFPWLKPDWGKLGLGFAYLFVGHWNSYCLWVIEIPTSGDLSIESLFNLMRQIFIVDPMILIFLSLVLMVQVVHLVTIWCNGRRGLSWHF